MTDDDGGYEVVFIDECIYDEQWGGARGFDPTTK